MIVEGGSCKRYDDTTIRSFLVSKDKNGSMFFLFNFNSSAKVRPINASNNNWKTMFFYQAHTLNGLLNASSQHIPVYFVAFVGAIHPCRTFVFGLFAVNRRRFHP